MRFKGSRDKDDGAEDLEDSSSVKSTTLFLPVVAIDPNPESGLFTFISSSLELDMERRRVESAFLDKHVE